MINSALNLIPTSGLIIILTILLILIVTTLKVRKKVKYWMILGIILGAAVAVATVYHSTPPAQEPEQLQQQQPESEPDLDQQQEPEQDQEVEAPQELTVKSDLDLVGLGADSYTASGEPVTVANNLATNSAGGPFATLTELLGNLDNPAKADFIETLKREVHVSDADIQRTLNLEENAKVAKAILVNNQQISDERARQIVVEKGLATETEAKVMKVVKTAGVRNSYLNKNKRIVFYEDYRSYVAVMICVMTGDDRAVPAVKTDCGNILNSIPKPKIKEKQKEKPPQKEKKQPKKEQKQPRDPQPTPKKPEVATKQVDIKKTFDAPNWVTRPSSIKVGIYVNGKQVQVVKLEKSRNYRASVNVNYQKGQKIAFQELNVPSHFSPSIYIDSKQNADRIVVSITNTYIGGGGGQHDDLKPKSDNKNDYAYPKGKSNNNKIDPTQAEEKPPVLEDKDKAQPAPTPTPKEQENINQHNDAVNEAAPLPGGEDAPPNDAAIDEPLNPNSGN